MSENKVIAAVIVLTLLLVGALGVKFYLVDKVSDTVIQKLQKPYAPGPYAPGVDPDKVNPVVLKAN
jgi:hypothetical protein